MHQSVAAEETHQNMGQNFILGHLLSRYDDLAGLGVKASGYLQNTQLHSQIFTKTPYLIYEKKTHLRPRTSWPRSTVRVVHI